MILLHTLTFTVFTSALINHALALIRFRSMQVVQEPETGIQSSPDVMFLCKRIFNRTEGQCPTVTLGCHLWSCVTMAMAAWQLYVKKWLMSDVVSIKRFVSLCSRMNAGAHQRLYALVKTILETEIPVLYVKVLRLQNKNFVKPKPAFALLAWFVKLGGQFKDCAIIVMLAT